MRTEIVEGQCILSMVWRMHIDQILRGMTLTFIQMHMWHAETM